jgi:gamma-glutamyltranspeptidase/glutathione hydrolase
LHLESNLYDLVGAPLKAMGHQVKSANGEDMGGYQAIWFHPIGVQGAASSTTSADRPISGVYRAASDHRKDGEAVGW